jgi:hypothetical protein
MRWCVALAAVLVALVVVAVRGLRRPAKHRPDANAVELVPAAQAEDPGASWAAPAAREAPGPAHLRGRVLYPAGAEASDDLEVIAEDATRRVTARIGDNGQFDIHLPSGRYTLVASAGELVGVVPDVLVHPGTSRDVDIRLAAGVTIRGTLRLPDDVEADVSITIVSPGREEQSGTYKIDDGRFSIEGLIAGRPYDITFRGEGLRSLTLTGVSAPADGLDVALQARAQVRGANGFPRDGDCPISSVALQVGGKTIRDENDDEVSIDVEDDCRFQLPVPDRVEAVTVVATGEGWHLEEPVTIPLGGDPAPICLNPPCSDPTRRGARLHLMLEGSGASQEVMVFAMEVVPSSPQHRVRSCSSEAGSCDIDGLKPGQKFVVSATGADCRGAPQEVTVAPGDNSLRIACVRHREIEGVLRIPQSEGRVSIRCPGSDERAVSGTRLFSLTCRADATAIEYQIGAEGIWRRVPVASASPSPSPDDDPAFVDIGPL